MKKGNDEREHAIVRRCSRQHDWRRRPYRTSAHPPTLYRSLPSSVVALLSSLLFVSLLASPHLFAALLVYTRAHGSAAATVTTTTTTTTAAAAVPALLVPAIRRGLGGGAAKLSSRSSDCTRGYSRAGVYACMNGYRDRDV